MKAQKTHRKSEIVKELTEQRALRTKMIQRQFLIKSTYKLESWTLLTRIYIRHAVSFRIFKVSMYALPLTFGVIHEYHSLGAFQCEKWRVVYKE